MRQPMEKPLRLNIESPQGHRSILAGSGKLTEVLRREALPLNTRCGQRGLCDGCAVELVRGRVVHCTTGAVVEAHEAPLEVRGCECRLVGDAEIRIPLRSLLAHEPQVVTNFRLNVARAHDPLWRPCEMERPLPNTDRPAIRNLGAAIDIGTTTVVVLLVDLATGEVVGQSAAFNRQMHLGDDVLTRINLCSTDSSMVSRLQESLVQETIAPLLREALASSHGGPNGDHVVCLVAAGNTTMLHLLAGIDPSSMGIAPFTPTFLEHRQMTCGGLHLQAPGLTADTPVHLLPSASAYVGADLCAGVLASGLLYDPGPSLLIDVGTNGEMILKHGDHLLGCATAAGPAFEGARLASGIRAGRGAIESIRLENNPFAICTQVIGGDKPVGICGSAYIDFLAEGRRTGLISTTGRFQADEFPGAAKYLTRDERLGLSLRIAYGRGREKVVICEADIASLLQAKAAIAAGMLTLLERAGLVPADLRKLYLAGGFGMHINIPNAIACGLLPGLNQEQVEVVGNTSLGGAYLALLDRNILKDLSRISQNLELVELNLDPGFESRYIDQLAMPT